ncbi:MAG: O-acetylhomoserine aminocarboxypropyltransferase/cysteine synthase [Fibrobacter sp.]|jgi:O-acetylhomoserine (thiol)-lyase|nr:O-acetylhomoserine aminocarboxypropyltransferase/cysteine synthase [Fibrobacter sp.]
MDSENKTGFETRMIHAGHRCDPYTGSSTVPIYQTSSYVFNDADHAARLFGLKEEGYIYSRISNPTTSVFEERMAALEGAVGAVAVSSGMAAQMAVFMTLLQPGDEVVASSHLYGGSVVQLTHLLKKMNISVKFVDPINIRNWEEALTLRTKALFGETIGNPSGSILDIEAIAALGRSRGIPLIVDNTFATPFLCRPFEYGAAIVVYSATKFIGGHGNCIGGVVLDSGNFDFSRFPSIADPSPAFHDCKFLEDFGPMGFLIKLRQEIVRDVGFCISPMNSFLLIQGLETLSLRMERHVENAMKVAFFLENHPKVAWVNYAGLSSSPFNSLCRKYFPLGPGSVFSFGLKPSDGKDVRDAGRTFISRLKIFTHLANIGDVRSLVIHPASTTHQQLSDEELRDAGIGPELIRLSVGLETIDDLFSDLEHALDDI